MKRLLRVNIQLGHQGACCKRPLQGFSFLGTPGVQSGADLLCSGQKTCVAEEKFSVAASALKGPSENTGVCSEHFLHKIPTTANPYPTLKLGYEKSKVKAERSLYRGEPHKKMVKVSTPSSSIIPPETPSISVHPVDMSSFVASSPVVSNQDHNYSLPSVVELCSGCKDKNDVIYTINFKMIRRIEN